MQDPQPVEDAAPQPQEAAPEPPQDAPATEAPVSDPQGDESVLEGGVDTIRERLSDFWDGLQSNMLTVGVAIEAAILLAAVVPAAFFGPRLRKLIQTQIAPRAPYGVLRRAANAFAHLATPIALYVVLQIAVIALQTANSSTGLISAAVSLLTAWIVVRLVTLVIRSPFWSRVAFYVIWPVMALDAFGVLDDVVRQLEAFSIPIGSDENGVEQAFSALDLLRTLAVFGVLFWGARFLNHLIQGRINAIDELTVSFKALLSKILDVLLPIVALLFKFWYLFAGKYYVEHLILALHNHSFLFVIFLLLMLANSLAGWLDPLEEGTLSTVVRWFNIALWTWTPIYLLLSLKQVYQQSWGLTTGKFMVIGLSYLVLLGLTTSVAAALSFVLL